MQLCNKTININYSNEKCLYMIHRHFLNLNDPYFVKKKNNHSNLDLLYWWSIIDNFKTIKQMFSITSNGLQYLYVYFMHSWYPYFPIQFKKHRSMGHKLSFTAQKPSKMKGIFKDNLLAS